MPSQLSFWSCLLAIVVLGWLHAWDIRRYIAHVFAIGVIMIYVSATMMVVQQHAHLFEAYWGIQTIKVEILDRLNQIEYQQSLLGVIQEPKALKHQRLMLYADIHSPLDIGDTWALEVRLIPIHGHFNRGSLLHERRWLSKHIYAKAKVISSIHLINKSYTFTWIRSQLMKRLVKHCDHWYSGGFVVAVLMGDKSWLDADIKQQFSELGISHLLAISGMHLGIWLWGCHNVLAWLRLDKSIKLAWSLMMLLVYLWLANYLPPIVRSGSMLVMGYVYRRMIGHIDWFKLWQISLMLALCYNPLFVYDVSFCLSYLAIGLMIYATLGYIETQSSWASYWRLQWYFYWGFLPINYIFFGHFPYLSFLVNIWMIPWATLYLIPMTFICALALLIAPEIVCDGMLRFVYEHSWRMTLMALTFMQRFSNYPIATMVHSPLNLVLLSLGMAVFLLPTSFKRRYWGLCVLYPWFFPSSDLLPDQWKVVLLDVGEGLSLVVESQQHLLVFDTGPRGAVMRYLLPYLRYRGLHHIDLLMISHGDQDHSSGLEYLLRYVHVDSIVSGQPERLGLKRKVELCHAGMQWKWNHLTIDVLAPVDHQVDGNNDHSCVLRVSDGSTDILITGDISKKQEASLVNQYQSGLKSDVLIVPHHGSYHSSSMAFVQATRPKIALVSSGFMNRWNHPHPLIVERYQSFGAEVRSTRTTGMIELNFGPEGDW